MKGLLYNDILLNRNYFIGTVIAMLAGAVVCPLLVHILDYGYNSIYVLAFVVIQLVILTIADEWLARSLENSLKNRFADYVLAAGISKNRYVFHLLENNLISTVFGIAMCCIVQLSMFLFGDKTLVNSQSFTALFFMAFLVGAVEYMIIPLVIPLKSAEKAGLIGGLVIGFVFIMPAAILNTLCETESIMSMLMKMISQQWFIPAASGLFVGLYALFYFIILARVKRGDMC